MKFQSRRRLLPAVLIFMSTFFSVCVSAQYNFPDEERKANNEQSVAGKFFIAPDLGLLLGTVTRIEVSPAIGYYLTERISVAVGGRYEYLKDSRNYYQMYSYKTNIYGLRAYTELDVIKNFDNVIPLGLSLGIFGHLEYEGLSLERKYFDYPNYPSEGRFWYSTALVGGGIRQPAGQRASFNLLFLWDTDTSIASLYSNPILRMGFQIYF
jgi:hypothetical protein